jgi:hypothetical protein
MPSDSPWPIVLSLFAALMFAMLLIGHYVLAGVFAALALGVLALWHAEEPGT